MACEALVVIVDLEKHLVAVGIEGTKVVLLVWIVGVMEIVKNSDGLDDPSYRLASESGDSRGHHRNALGKILAQRVVQCANAHSFGIHDSAPDFRSGKLQTERGRPDQAT